MLSLRTSATLFIAIVLVACERSDTVANASGDSLSADSAQAQHVREVAAAGGVIDSILPIAEQLTRFREGLPATDTLHNASASIDALLSRWARALSTRDTTELNAMILDRSEFAWLYYPGSKLSLPPYEAPPQLLWGQLLASSNKGAVGMLNRVGGKSLTVGALQCPAAPEVEGSNRLYSRCTVRLTPKGETPLEAQLFGTIIERDGRFKFIGLANSL